MEAVLQPFLLLNPLVHLRRIIGLELIKQSVRSGIGKNHATVLLHKKSVQDHSIHMLRKAGVIPFTSSIHTLGVIAS